MEQNIQNTENPGVELVGGEGRDFLRGTAGDDVIDGGNGNDNLSGGDGNDLIIGGRGRDTLDGGAGDDTFVYTEGDGSDRIRNFDLLGNDTLAIDVDGINNLDDLLATASVSSSGSNDLVTFNFGGGDTLRLLTDDFNNLTADDFIFGEAPQQAVEQASVQPVVQPVVDGVSPIINSQFVTVTGEDIGDGSGIDPNDNRPSEVVTDGVVVELETPNEQAPVAEVAPEPVEQPIQPVEEPAQPAEEPANPLVDGVNSQFEIITGEDIGDGSGIDPNNNRPSEVVTQGTVVEIETPVQPEPQNPGVELTGGAGRDFLRGTAGDDVIDGGDGSDNLSGGDGNDVIVGGRGRDTLDGGAGDDTFVFNEGDGSDRIRNFDLLGDDTLLLNVDGINNIDDLLATASVSSSGSNDLVTFNFGGGDTLRLLTDDFDNLAVDDFIFA